MHNWKGRAAQPEWMASPETYEVNRLPQHSMFMTYADETSCRAGYSLQSSRCLSLNGDWLFHMIEGTEDIPAFHDESYRAEGWNTITVPSCWQCEGYGAPHYTNTAYPWEGHEDVMPPRAPEHYNQVGCYIRWFTLSEKERDGVTLLSFQGVESAFYVYVNGRFVGYSEDSFTPAEFDISPFVRTGENRVSVEVYRFSSASWLEAQDFWRLSGIFRDVFLRFAPSTYLHDIVADIHLADDFLTAWLTVHVELGNPRPDAKLFWKLLSPVGDTVQEGGRCIHFL